MRIHSALVLAFGILLITPASSLASHHIIPTPQYVHFGSGSVNLADWATRNAAVVVLAGDEPEYSIAVSLLQREARVSAGRPIDLVRREECSGDPCILMMSWKSASSAVPEITGFLTAEDRQVLSDPGETGQAYVIRTDSSSNRIYLIGSTPLGTLYAATTLVQIWSSDENGLQISETHVRDFPDFKYRGAADWLLRAELNRWGYDWGDGRRAFVERIKRKLDFCLRFKINMVFFDGFGWNPGRVPGYGAMMREINEYARARGIKLVLAGFAANFDPLKVEPEFNIGEVFLNRRNYPFGEIYECFGELRTPLHPTLGTCRANEDLNRQIATRIQEFVRVVEPGALYIHHEDTGHFDSTQDRWKDRCALCRQRWPNDDFTAKDGGAGAIAHRASLIVESVNQVSNFDSGYKAKEDCTLIFISPAYGIDSGRSGLSSDPTDEELNWERTLEFWSNVVALLPTTANIQIGFREIFPRVSTGENWIDAFNSRLRLDGLEAKVFLFFLGGADQYSAGDFTFPYSGTPVMNRMFNGAEAIYSFSGGVHQEPLQVVNAQFSWNSTAPGSLNPTTFESALATWNALKSNDLLPDEVFAKNAVFDQACHKIYGPRSGEIISQFFHYFEQLKESENIFVPNFYPRKIYPLPVLWRVLQADSRYWNFADEPKLLEELQLHGVNRTQLHHGLSRFWSQTSEVTQKGKKLVEAALDVADLRLDAKPDLEHLLRCLEVTIRFSHFLASYHQLIGNNVEGKLVENDVLEHLKKLAQISRYLESTFAFDTVDPKGGDLSSWSLALEEIRNQLSAYASGMTTAVREIR